MWESSMWLGKNIVALIKKNSRKACALASAILVKQHSVKQCAVGYLSTLIFKLDLVAFSSLMLILYHTVPNFSNPEKISFENTVRKGENAGTQHFLIFSQRFIL